MKTESEKSDFMLLLRQPNKGPHPSPAEMEKIMARFTTWMDAMTKKGAVRGTAGLEASGKILRGSGDALVITDGPYVEATEVIGGYVLIAAANLEAAVEIARDCPGLDHRMAVEIRPVKHQMKPAGEK